MEHTKVLHSKLLLQRGDDALEQRLTEGCENNVINIEQQICSLSPTVIDKQSVGIWGSKNKNFLPHKPGLLQL